jgi:acetoacetyl-CoA reductase
MDLPGLPLAVRRSWKAGGGDARRVAEPSCVQLRGSVALITGASRGIGSIIAQELARHGAHAVVNYRENGQLAEGVVAAILAAGGSAEAEQADVRDPAAVQAMVDRIAARRGTVEVLVNNAGIVRDRLFRKMVADDWRAVIETNLFGVMNCAHAVVPGMLELGRGRIVNISSFVGQTGAFGQTNYAAAKAGVIGFTRSLALELATSGITVNAVCPGFIDTDMWQTIRPEIQRTLVGRVPVGRIGAPEEVAAMVSFLVEGGAYVTGQTLNVNGGIYMG